MRKAFLIFGLSMMITAYLTFFLNFLGAYSSPFKSALITINEHGEANIELALLLVSFPFVFFTAWTVIGWIARRQIA